MNKLAKIASTALLCLMPFSNSNAQTVNKAAAEISYTEGNTIVKFRPYDYTAPSGRQRTDFSFGRKFGDVNLLTYMKEDNKNGSWTGGSLEFKKALSENMKLGVTGVYLFGLNEKSKDEWYFVPSITKNFGDFSAGILSFSKGYIGDEPVSYFGPIVGCKLTDNITTTLYPSIDLLGKGNFVFWKTNMSFKK